MSAFAVGAAGMLAHRLANGPSEKLESVRKNFERMQRDMDEIFNSPQGQGAGDDGAERVEAGELR